MTPAMAAAKARAYIRMVMRIQDSNEAHAAYLHLPSARPGEDLHPDVRQLDEAIQTALATLDPHTAARLAELETRLAAYSRDAMADALYKRRPPEPPGVWVLRIHGRYAADGCEITLWGSEDAAYAALAAHVRNQLWHPTLAEDGLPATPPDDDEEVVDLYYGDEQARGGSSYTLQQLTIGD